ncbi:hypothetical protein [Yersinia intermedia]|uniref:hypothetical protein n=1 Tax=Yersinia intermedia TaxID=631 RepID=UPI000B67A721|nr:hypothetical protein [Yersinia intermedia]MCW8114121.1 hypothetical protein [Yersinia intermedia]MDA5518902.1 hypothetical protein [Yersinia intermedia]OWF85996.1 hypothetical protein B4916_23065 [Yersinia intermedia]
MARALCRLDVPVVNGMSVGEGDWGRVIETATNELGLYILLRDELRDKGWRLALVEPHGERTFVTIMGCEAHWDLSQLMPLPLTPETVVYANGYELVGEALHEWLVCLPVNQCRVIDPGPRVNQLNADFLTG